MPKSICDFCSSPNVTWVYPARTFAAYVFEGIVGESVGDWASATTCGPRTAASTARRWGRGSSAGPTH